MAKIIYSEILIHATPEKIWNILMDFKSYPQWNPMIKSIEGIPDLRKQLTVRIEPPEATGMTFKPVLQTIKDTQEFSWLGHLWIKGIFDGHHQFQLKDNLDGTTLFIQKETFTGILVPLFKKMLDINTLNGFKLMNQELKKKAEN